MTKLARARAPSLPSDTPCPRQTRTRCSWSTVRGRGALGPGASGAEACKAGRRRQPGERRQRRRPTWPPLPAPPEHAVRPATRPPAPRPGRPARQETKQHSSCCSGGDWPLPPPPPLPPTPRAPSSSRPSGRSRPRPRRACARSPSSGACRPGGGPSQSARPAARNAASASLADGRATVVDAPLNRSPPLAALLAVARPALVIFDKFTAEEAFSHAVREHAPGAARVVDLQDVASLRRARGRAVGEADERAKGAAAPPPPPCLAATAAETSTPPPLSRSTPPWPPSRPRGATRPAGARWRPSCGATPPWCARPWRARSWPAGGACRRQARARPFFARPLGHRRAVTPVGRSWGDRTHFVMVGHHGHAQRGRPDLADAPGGAWQPLRTPTRCRAARVGRVRECGGPGRRLRSPPHLARGRAPNLSVLGRARVLLAPLRFGAGLKGKVVEAWARGTPVVTTPIGAEGSFPAAASGAAPPASPRRRTRRAGGGGAGRTGRGDRTAARGARAGGLPRRGRRAVGRPVDRAGRGRLCGGRGPPV